MTRRSVNVSRCVCVCVSEQFIKPDAAVDDRMEPQGKAQGESYNPLKTGLRGLDDKGKEAQIPW